MKKPIHVLACMFAAAALAITAVPAEAKGKASGKKPSASKTVKASKSKG